MRRDKELAEEILRTLVLDEHWHMDMRMLVERLKDKAAESAVRYHAVLLQDVGLVKVDQGVIRLTSAGQDRAENSDKLDPMATWAALGS
ncbi:hypothetical protein [Trinickia symbiotica]|nr:hypothetical protein [Trinickia symbiotica]